MKKLDYLLLYFYSLMVVAVICHTIFHFVGFQWGKLLSDLSLLQSFLFLVFSLTLALTALVVLIIKITQFVTVHAVQQKVESILTASQRKEIAPKELNQQLDLLDSKLLRLEENLQNRKDKQPIEFPSAGSTFKRGEDYITAKLIDECGLKGYTIGGAQVSEKHAGFIINKGNSTADDVINLIEHVKKIVYKETGKKINLEVEIIGE